MGLDLLSIYHALGSDHNVVIGRVGQTKSASRWALTSLTRDTLIGVKEPLDFILVRRRTISMSADAGEAVFISRLSS